MCVHDPNAPPLGDLTIIDGGTNAVVATIPLGKRPRGIKVSPDGTKLFVALSGSPMAPPGTDESKLPPPDRTADGIGVVDIASRKVTTVLTSGTPLTLTYSGGTPSALLCIRNVNISNLDTAWPATFGTSTCQTAGAVGLYLVTYR